MECGKQHQRRFEIQHRSTFDLYAGVNTIAYKFDNGDTGIINLDHIRVSPAPIEAETATRLGFASVYNDSSASGGQAVQYLHVSGNGIQFNNVPAANSLTVRYAATSSGTYSMYVNEVKTKTINFTWNDGIWYWRLYQSFGSSSCQRRSISTAGIQEIRVNSVDGIHPTQNSARKIEIIGDSITAGYGVDDVKENGFSTATEDVTKTYAYKTAAALQADYSVVAYSGHGIVSGYTGNGEKNTGLLVPNNYDIIARSAGRIDGNLDINNSPWNFNKFLSYPDCNKSWDERLFVYKG